VRTVTDWSYDGADQLVTETEGAAVTAYAFDRNGNQQVVTAPDGSRTTYAWDPENRLTEIALADGSRNTMSYRALDGLRHRLFDSEGDKRMVWDSQGSSGYKDLLEESLLGAALRTYYRGHSLAAMREGAAGANRYYHYDHQGTVQCLTDETGAVTDRFSSNAWGVPVQRTGSSINRHWYIGNWGYYRQVDQALDYVRARWIRLSTALWLSKDPLPLNLRHQSVYPYVLNWPVSSYDPTGLICGGNVASKECKRVDCNRLVILPCSECRWEEGLSQFGCKTMDCPPVTCTDEDENKQLQSLFRRLVEIALTQLPEACRGGSGLGGSPPHARTLCCAYPRGVVGPGCDSAIKCVICRGNPKHQDVNELINLGHTCIVECLYHHEYDHQRQCVRPNVREPRTPECLPYVEECKCLLSKMARGLRQTVLPTGLIQSLQNSCCTSASHLQNCEKHLKSLQMHLPLPP
jgi:RHS repeat-associated protein